MKNWIAELIAEVKVRRDIFLGDSLSTLLFVITTIPLSYILRICTEGYSYRKAVLNFNHCMSDIKLFAKNEKEQETLIQTIGINNQEIGMEFRIENMPC